MLMLRLPILLSITELKIQTKVKDFQMTIYLKTKKIVIIISSEYLTAEILELFADQDDCI